jgi:hypothetical protein
MQVLMIYSVPSAARRTWISNPIYTNRCAAREDAQYNDEFLETTLVIQ